MCTNPYLDARQRMVREQIRARGITSERVLAVMEQVPRERFVPERDRPDAFCDRALSIACGQTISQPFMVAAMTDCLGLEGHHRVLEIVVPEKVALRFFPVGTGHPRAEGGRMTPDPGHQAA